MLLNLQEVSSQSVAFLSSEYVGSNFFKHDLKEGEVQCATSFVLYNRIHPFSAISCPISPEGRNLYSRIISLFCSCSFLPPPHPHLPAAYRV